MGDGVQAITGRRGRLARGLRIAVLVAAGVSPVASHVALLTGCGVGVAVSLGVLQAVAVGLVIAGTGRHRGVAVLASACMLAVLAFGLMRSPALGLRLAAGTSHALLYSALCVGFAVTLLPGRTDVVTLVAQRLNPNFHAGMRFYTRRVTIAWCLFFAGQLLTSALLLLLAPERWWLLFVNTLSMPLMGLMFVGEYVIRRRLFPGAQSANLATMIRNFRRPGAAPGQDGVGAPGQAVPPGNLGH
jgi:uncharacterized membrane protein